MVEFIIFEDDVDITNYKYLILNLLACRENEFKIRDYNDKVVFDGNKIFILCSKNLKNIEKVASRIRKANDWNSQIIVVGSERNLLDHDELLILDFIEKDDQFKANFRKALYTAYKILTSKSSFSFLYDGHIYNIPYSDILFFEKCNNQNYCYLYTKYDKYIVKSTIKDIENNLDAFYFMKTHRSCIVNVDNITSYDCCENVIMFGKQKIYLITKQKRPFLKQKLINRK